VRLSQVNLRLSILQAERGGSLLRTFQWLEARESEPHDVASLAGFCHRSTSLFGTGICLGEGFAEPDADTTWVVVVHMRMIVRSRL